MPLTLITGAPGWIGTRLVRVLLDGASPDAFPLPRPAGQRRVRCLVLPGVDTSAPGRPDRLEIVRGDPQDPDAVEALCHGTEGATLYHCAGVVHPRRFVREFQVNVCGARSLLQAAEAAGVRRVVALSFNSPVGAKPRRDHRFDGLSS